MKKQVHVGCMDNKDIKFCVAMSWEQLQHLLIEWKLCGANQWQED